MKPAHAHPKRTLHVILQGRASSLSRQSDWFGVQEPCAWYHRQGLWVDHHTSAPGSLRPLFFSYIIHYMTVRVCFQPRNSLCCWSNGMWCCRATGLGFVCFVVLSPRVFSANRVDLGLFFFCSQMFPFSLITLYRSRSGWHGNASSGLFGLSDATWDSPGRSGRSRLGEGGGEDDIVVAWCIFT